MEPPHLGLSRYTLHWWRSIFPDSAKKYLLKQAAYLPASQKRLLQLIYDRLPDGSYQNLNAEQQMLVDAGIYIAANQLAQAAAACRNIQKTQPSDKEWVQSLIAEIEAISKHGRQLENTI